MQLMSLGTGTLRIAEELGIGPQAVRNHVRNLRGKLGPNSKLAAVLTALRLGILVWNQGVFTQAPVHRLALILHVSGHTDLCQPRQPSVFG